MVNVESVRYFWLSSVNCAKLRDYIVETGLYYFFVLLFQPANFAECIALTCALYV